MDLELYLNPINKELYKKYQIKISIGTDLQWLEVHLLYRLENVIKIPTGIEYVPRSNIKFFQDTDLFKNLKFKEI